MISIVNNLTAMNTQRQLGLVTNKKAKTSERLSSGYKINRAADDAAGLTISEKMRAQIRGLNQGSDNIQDGISLIQIADGALAEVNDMLHRMTELSVKSANGTNTDADREAIQQEMNALISEIDRVGKSAEFNTMPILDDAFGVEDPTSIKEFVKSKSAQAGYFQEAYYDGASGKYFPAANLDFSNVNASNIDKLYNNGFSFICGHGCGQVFNFKFINGDGTQSKLSGRSSYEIDIGGLKTGSQVINKILEVANAKSPYSENALTGVKQIAHKQGLLASGSTLIVVDTMKEKLADKGGCATEIAAKSVYPKSPGSSEGSIDATSIMKPIQNDLVNEFNIQCSNVTNDNLVIKTRRMNADVIGVDTVNVSTEKGAKEAIKAIEDAGMIVSSMRSELGAYQNRLEHSYNNNENKSENTTAAESRLRDADMAKEMTNFSLVNILQQAGISMLSQANQSTQSVLSLLQ